MTFVSGSDKLFILGTSPGVLDVQIGALQTMRLTGFEELLDAATDDTYQFEDMITDPADCLPSDNFFSDPLYTSNEWVFDMINVEPVWERGIFGNGVRVRINDQGEEISMFP